MPSPLAEKSIGLSRKAFALIGVCVLIAAAGVVFAIQPQARPPSLIGGPFHLQNAEGKTVTEADFLGAPFLVYFGYTHCPDICPTTLAQISDVMKRLPDKPIKAVFITVDPERDTPKLMGDYVSSFDPRIVGLSGTPEEIAAAEKVYRVYARKAPNKDGDYAMDHSSIIYLMDAKGAFVEPFDLERTPDEAAAELKKYF
jgi:protein SCO1/2